MIVLIRSAAGVFAADIVPSTGTSERPSVHDALTTTWDLVRDHEPIDGAWVREVRGGNAAYRARQYSEAIVDARGSSVKGENPSTETFSEAHVYSIGTEGEELVRT